MLGYGTESGGKMPVYYGLRLYTDESEQKKYLKDPTKLGGDGYDSAISKINEKNLQKIADDLGVAYQHRDSLSRPVSTVVDASKAKVVSDTHRETLHYMNLYWVLAIPLVGLLLWWLHDVLPALRQLRKDKERMV